ncbi:hypothetical protein, partial [Parapedobacter lycopersici]|uniref:hypothetical protein n=1 Tax=Parapedobacter lycopersici TaxID=1864939 RepID=UPI00334009F4
VGPYRPYVRLRTEIEEQTRADVFVFFNKLKLYQLPVFYPLLYFIVVRIHLISKLRHLLSVSFTPWEDAAFQRYFYCCDFRNSTKANEISTTSIPKILLTFNKDSPVTPW